MSHSRLLLIVAAVLLVLASITTAGASIAGVAAWTWAFGGFAAWAFAQTGL